jgi:hypothetical protein
MKNVYLNAEVNMESNHEVTCILSSFKVVFVNAHYDESILYFLTRVSQ